MPKTELHELPIPQEVLEASSAHELIRFWVADSNEYVSMNISGFDDNSQEPVLWGMILADIAMHAINGMQKNHSTDMGPDEMLEDIMYGFEQRIEHKPKHLTELGSKQNAH